LALVALAVLAVGSIVLLAVPRSSPPIMLDMCEQPPNPKTSAIAQMLKMRILNLP
jgi:hypothetical protein